MDTPKPVDINRLKGILGKSKALMNKVETGDYETGHVDARALTEDGVKDMMAEGIAPRMHSQPQAQQQAITPERIAQSRMPEAIKRAMLENPIPQPVMNHTFTLDDVADFAQDDKPMPYPKANNYRKTAPAQPIMENMVQGMVGLNETQVRTIVKDEIIEFLTKYFTKSLTEDVQNKVIKQLLETGKIKVKK
jgi:hypothetical protein